MKTPRATRQRAVWWLVPVLGLAAWVRLAVYQRVLVGGELRPADADSEYHLRRILTVYEQWPRLASWDSLLAWPKGHLQLWAPGFDWVGAAWLKLTPASDPQTLALAAALFPVMLGLLTVWVVVDLTRRLAPEAPAATPFLAGVLAALVPQFVGCSRLGRTDHHVWEALSLALLTTWVVRRFDEPRGWRFEALGALAVTVTLAGFSGGALYVAIATGVLLAAALWAPSPLVGSGAPALTVGSLLCLLLNLGLISDRGAALSFMVPSALQPLLTLGAAASVAWAVAVGRRLSRETAFRRLGAFSAGLGALLIVVLVAPGVGPQVRGGLTGWLLKADPWLAAVSEFQPLFSLGRAPLSAILFYLGVPGLLAVPLLGVALLGWRRLVPRKARDERGGDERNRSPRASRGVMSEVARINRAPALLAFTFVFLTLWALTLLQMRFGRVLGPLLGVAVALGLAAVASRLTRRAPSLVAVGLALGLVAVDPEARRELLIAPARELSAVEEAVAVLDLGTHPAVPGQRAGVLAPWDLGSTLVSLANRPVIACGFGTYLDPDGFAAARRALSTDEATLLEVMSQRDLGFVVGGAAALLKEPAEGNSFLMRLPSGRGVINPGYLDLRPISALAFGGSGIPTMHLPHLERLMPLGVSRDAVEPLDWPLRVLWIYERVEGAVLTGQTAPGALVEATLEGRPFSWTAWGTAGSDGRFALRVPVSTSYWGHGFQTFDRWLISAPGLSASAATPEAAVRSGAVVPVTSR